ncbi:NAD(P)-binding protein [Auriscalpium vulgare]|uniref:NAD(P)-binding protein n=1 Tax=Auriscalpium vulgare TaxID=40419 RepID=A0ACB8RR97_9AGAM|nr:NAD(P)-binding protein [Auriscalpium vulgare]
MGKLSLLQFLAGQLKSVPPVETRDLKGETVLVVGANVGLGFEAAKHFALMKPEKLVLACRSVKKGEDAARAITESTGFAGGIYVRQVDLTVFDSVIAFADLFERDFRSLDIYVYNAGVLSSAFGQTVDGWENTLEVNHLSCVLLTILMWPCLRRACRPDSRPRTVIVSSDVHYWTTFDPELLGSPDILEKLNDKDYCTPAVVRRRYFDTKLLGVFFVRELASRIFADSSVIPVAVNPGFCKSALRRNFAFPMSLIDSIGDFLFARSTEEGARQLVWAAVGGRESEHELHGAYVSDAGVKEPSDFVLSEEGNRVQKRVWEETVRVLSEVSPRFKEVLAGMLDEEA